MSGFFVANQFLWDLKSPVDQSNLGQKLIKKAQEAGFEQKYEVETSKGALGPHSGKFERFYYLDQPEKYIQPLDKDILVIGQYGPTLAAAASPLNVNMLEASSIYLDDYDLDFLKRFKIVFLYGFGYHDKEDAENLIKEYSAGGGKVVIDMFGMKKSQIEESPIFLGVTGSPIKITAPLAIETNETINNLMPKTFQVPSEVVDASSEGELELKSMAEWNALEYYNLDDSWANFAGDDKLYSILGSKKINNNPVIFVGGNLFYHLYLSHDQNELRMLEFILKLEDYQPKKEESIFAQDPTFTANQVNLDANYWKFNISNRSDRLALISLAYSPNWKAFIDSQETKVYEAENLMVLKVPQGEHTLEIRYQNYSRIKIVSLLITLLTAGFLIYLLIYNRKYGKVLDKG